MRAALVRLVRPYIVHASHMGLFDKAGEVQQDTFTIEVHLESPREKLRDGTVMPLKELDVCMAPVLARIRGQRLDLLEPKTKFEPLVSCPTAENLALYLFDKLQFLGNDGRQRFAGVRVREGDQWWAEVFA